MSNWNSELRGEIPVLCYSVAMKPFDVIPLTEIDTRTMASRLHPKLCIIGDLLDINRPSGGYSLQLCWTTGWVAGSHV